jgi:hypothetical protein
MPAYDEELFGPVAAIIPVADEAEAVRVANDSVFGLGQPSSPATVSAASGLPLNRIEAGSVFVNSFVKSDPRLTLWRYQRERLWAGAVALRHQGICQYQDGICDVTASDTDTITPEEARCFYDSLGSTYDIGERFERRAKARGFVLLHLAPGQRVLNVGVGTGKDQAQIQNALMPGGLAAGVDLSPVMVKLARANVAASRK